MSLFITLFFLSGCNSNVSSVNAPPNRPQHPKTPTSPHTPHAQKSKPKVPAPLSKVSVAQRTEYLNAINAARAETQDCGDRGVFDPAPLLKWNTRLDNAAYEHSNDMAQSNLFSHMGSGTASDITAQEEKLGRGSRLRERIDHHRYADWHSIGENIAGGYEDAQSTINSWLKSPEHCANLMNPKFTEAGMALVEKSGTEYTQYWTVDFGGK